MARLAEEYAYYAGGRLRRVTVARADSAAGLAAGRKGRKGSLIPALDPRRILRSAAAADRRPSRFIQAPERFVASEEPGLLLIPTESFVIEGGKSAVVQRLRRDHGVEVLAEGSHGKVLLRAPQDARDRVRAAFDLSREAWKTGAVAAAHPNFLRAGSRTPASTSSALSAWNLENDGRLGVAGADVRARRAWTITRGNPDVLVAVIDEGVDGLHPDLAPALRRERDFVDGRSHARPEPHDAHGTASAGIVAGRSERWPGVAPEVGLMAARVARGDGEGHWIADDFDFADAIDWAWANGADVISLGWGGGPAVDAIDHAIERARRRGRRGKGTVVVAAAGNTEDAVQYPATLEGVIAVGASNQWDERKTRQSRDGEAGWGSNFGPALSLLAPGVCIATTDNHGPYGYSPLDHTLNFSGTSAAAPHVAAAAALLMSAVRGLTEARVRELLRGSADHIPGQTRWTAQLGAGRLNVHQALLNARKR